MWMDKIRPHEKGLILITAVDKIDRLIGNPIRKMKSLFQMPRAGRVSIPVTPVSV
jgi:hypothetical protein